MAMYNTEPSESAKPNSRRERLHKRLGALRTERSSFIAHWRDLATFISPRRGRFFIEDRNRGDKRYNDIINSKATRALRISQAGMFAGVMSPTRPWHTLEPQDLDMMEYAPVKVWLHKVETIQRSIFNASNLYNMAPVMIGEALQFGTGAMFHVDDFENVARFYTQTIGSYMIAQNDRFEVDTFVREYQMTVAQMVKQFGLDKVSTEVRQAYDRSEYDKWYDCVHMITPNELADPNSKMSSRKPFLSVYYQPGRNTSRSDGFLSEAGFDEFPIYILRWSLAGEDIYATDCPGMTALGDIKMLQIMEKRKAQAIDKMVNPPLQGPPSLRNRTVTTLPGGLNLFDEAGTGEGLRTVYQVEPRLQEMLLDIHSIERRIDESFFVDLFLAITEIEGIQPRNQYDLVQRHEERLLQIGPVLERLHGEFLSPLVNRTFNQMVRAKILPPPPQELQGQELNIRFVSTLAQAQRAVATNTIDKLVGFTAGLAKTGFTSALDKIDADQMIDEYAQAIGVPPRVVVPDDMVAKIRADRQQMEMQAMQMQQVQSGANAAKMLSDAKLGDKNVLSKAMGGGGDE